MPTHTMAITTTLWMTASRTVMWSCQCTCLTNHHYKMRARNSRISVTKLTTCPCQLWPLTKIPGGTQILSPIQTTQQLWWSDGKVTLWVCLQLIRTTFQKTVHWLPRSKPGKRQWDSTHLSLVRYHISDSDPWKRFLLWKIISIQNVILNLKITLKRMVFKREHHSTADVPTVFQKSWSSMGRKGTVWKLCSLLKTYLTDIYPWSVIGILPSKDTWCSLPYRCSCLPSSNKTHPHLSTEW